MASKKPGKYANVKGYDPGPFWPEAKPLSELDETDRCFLRAANGGVDVWCPLDADAIDSILSGRKRSHCARDGHLKLGSMVRFFDPEAKKHVDVRVTDVGLPFKNLRCGPIVKVEFEPV